MWYNDSKYNYRRRDMNEEDDIFKVGQLGIQIFMSNKNEKLCKK